MAIFQADMSIKTAIELGMEDLRKNPWLIDDILGDCLTNPYLKDKYGQKQIDSCKEWFANNQIDVLMTPRRDKDRLPCVTVTMGTSQEKSEMKTMADQSTETITLMPNQIGKPIPFVVKPFTIDGYDDVTGEVTIASDTPGLRSVAPGMILVDPLTGQGYPIHTVSPHGVTIQDGLTLTVTKFAIVPQYQTYKARIEHSFFQETYVVGCHVHGDPQSLLWLHSIVLYSILRYREGLLEANGFAESVVGSGDLEPNEFFTGPGGEDAFSRYITLTGQVENSWIKSPRRTIETMGLGEKLSDGFRGGIKILSNFDSPPTIDKTQEIWYTDAENENDPDDTEDQDE